MIGEALRLIRVYHDIKAIDLAKQLGISSGYLSEIENQKKNPSIELIYKYAEIFNTKPSAILFFDEQLQDDILKENNSFYSQFKGKLTKAIRFKIVTFLKAIENSGNEV
jgi:transcriptional regulator with XRE-family HTH domain